MTTKEFFASPAVIQYLSGETTRANTVRPVIDLLNGLSSEDLEEIASCFSPDPKDLDLSERCLKDTVEQVICRKKGLLVVV